jgi:hypothetical protein
MVAVGRQVVQVTWGLSFPQFPVVRLLLRVPGKPAAGKTTAALTSDVRKYSWSCGFVVVYTLRTTDDT